MSKVSKADTIRHFFEWHFPEPFASEFIKTATALLDGSVNSVDEAITRALAESPMAFDETALDKVLDFIEKKPGPYLLEGSKSIQCPGDKLLCQLDGMLAIPSIELQMDNLAWEAAAELLTCYAEKNPKETINSIRHLLMYTVLPPETLELIDIDPDESEEDERDPFFWEESGFDPDELNEWDYEIGDDTSVNKKLQALLKIILAAAGLDALYDIVFNDKKVAKALKKIWKEIRKPQPSGKKIGKQLKKILKRFRGKKFRKKLLKRFGKKGAAKILGKVAVRLTPWGLLFMVVFLLEALYDNGRDLLDP